MSSTWNRYLERKERARLAHNERNRAYHARKKAEREPRQFESDAYPLRLRIQRILANVKWRCAHKERYVQRGIKCQINHSHILFAWHRDGADQMQRPSLDRRDNDGDYSPENIRFIELELNISLGTKVRDEERMARLAERQSA